MKELFISLAALLLSAASVFANCPGCITELPAGLPEDTIFLTAAPDGQVGQAYVGDLSFRMPKTTTPVNASDPTTPAGLPISSITISSVANVPPGLSWEANQDVFEVNEETDGCVRFCGTPIIPGYYEIEVIITAQVLFANRTSSFTLPMLILPGQSVSEGFTIDNISGCGELLAGFTNNLPSNGQDGYSYIWDFGNGESSTLENPGPQHYDTPGEYDISYQAIIDTFGYLLNRVTVTSASCNDVFGGAPDLYIELFNDAGTLVYQSPAIQNASFPAVFEPNIFLADEPYVLILMDDDSGVDGADDFCGAFALSQGTNGVLTHPGATINISVLHPVDTIRSEGSVQVFPQPEPPSLLGYGGEILCEGDTIDLLTNYDSSTQWYRDSTPLLGANGPLLTVAQSGQYWLNYTNAEGCTATSDSLLLAFGELPAFPVFQNQDNLLVLFEPEVLPAQPVFQWFLDGQPLEAGNDPDYCISVSGQYALEVTDAENGCSRTFTQFMNYDPDFPNCMPVSAREAKGLPGLKVYPTLVHDGRVFLEGSLPGSPLEVRLFNAQGQLMQLARYDTGSAGLQAELRLGDYPAGMYFLSAVVPGGSATFKLVLTGN